jgi:serine/threonine-protein kinase
LLLANKDSESFRKSITDWSPDGHRLLFLDVVAGSAALMELHLESRKVTALLDTQANDTAGTISPDGRWLAYVSNDTGRTEIYMRPYPNVGDDRIAVTSSGGRMPVWRSDGRELIVRSLGGDPVSVPVTYPNGTIRLGKPSRIVEIRDAGGGVAAPFPDGAKFLYASAGSTADHPKEFRVILNWFEELKAKFAPAK